MMLTAAGMLLAGAAQGQQSGADPTRPLATGATESTVALAVSWGAATDVLLICPGQRDQDAANGLISRFNHLARPLAIEQRAWISGFVAARMEQFRTPNPDQRQAACTSALASLARAEMRRGAR